MGGHAGPHSGRLGLACGSEADANALAMALRADDGTQATAAGPRVEVHVRATSPLGLLRSLEDVLECARATGLLLGAASARPGAGLPADAQPGAQD